ncbi:hybrid sensor histidine kinase/response regulator [Solimonas soli]|uniref:hybrid sensor histidine kinase/response regulator n=1 Tax=Solimonas soli TaxID=413479 RepID=UPI0004B42781|nr:hybrid sensor histidine kinase/response regulator [Solimonas soli]
MPLENPPPPTRIKCLLVDDVDANLLALAALLRSDDVELLTARSGVEALELLLAHDIALALLDVQMPEMDGFQLAELMRGSERTRHVPIIFITAGGRDERRVFKGYESGGVDFLHKPINPVILRNKADVFFRLYRQQQQLAYELRERTEALHLAEMFMAVLGHDLRNPLSAVMLMASAIEGATPERVAALTSRIISSSQRMARMIDDLLDVVRARLAGGIAIRREAADLGVLVRRVVHEHRAAHPQRRITITEDGDLGGEWDADRLAQVASNLIGNALKHGDAAGAVEIHLDGRAPGAATFSVRNGGRIPPELLPMLFDPFRGRSQNEGRRDGLGLGLYIVKQIVDAHGGEVEVESAGAQTCFVVRLPRGAAADEDAARETQRFQGPPNSRASMRE